jgi:hypothetical protein
VALALLVKDLRAALARIRLQIAAAAAAAHLLLAALRVARLVASVARGLRRQLPARLSLTLAAAVAHLHPLLGQQAALAARVAAALAVTKVRLEPQGLQTRAAVVVAAQTMGQPRRLAELVVPA